MAIEGSVPSRLWGRVTGRWKVTRAEALEVSVAAKASTPTVMNLPCLLDLKARRVYLRVLSARASCQ